MRIIEQNEVRLVVQHRRPGMAVMLGIFTVLSIGFLVNILVQGIPRIAILDPFQLISWVVWIIFAIVLTGLGALVTFNASNGTRCTFDRQSETAQIRMPQYLHMETRDLSIYSIDRVEVETNDEVKATAVFLVLRSGERIPLATVPHFDEPSARACTTQMRAFLLRAS